MALHPSDPVDSPHEQQRLLEAMLDQVQSVAVIYDQNGVVRLANLFARNLLGFDPLGLPRAELFARLVVTDEQGCRVPPEQMPASRAARGEIVQGQRLTLVNTLGQEFSIIASATPLSAAGQPEGVISVWNDYTAHKQVQDALAAAVREVEHDKNRLQAVLDTLPVGVAIYDLQGGVTQSNRGYDEVWGSPRPPADSVDDYASYQAWWVQTGQPVRPEEWAAAQTIATGQPVYNQFFKIRRFDGTLAFVFNSAAPLFDSAGQLTGCTVAIRDVTDQVQSSQALRASEERLRVAIASLPITVFTMDHNLRYTWIYNPPPGVDSDASLGLSDLETLKGNENMESEIRYKRAVLDSGQGSQHEVSGIYNGEIHYYHVNLEPLRDETGQVAGLTGSMMDVTDQRRIQNAHFAAVAQMELQRSLLEHRERERSEIARDIHDGPIQAIVARLFNLQVARAATSDPSAQQVLDETAAGLRAVVQELRDVVNELRPPVLIRYGLARAIQIHSEDFRARFSAIALDLDLVEDERLLPEETCLALYRIYQESLNNVVRHAEARRVWVRYYPFEGRVILEIKDDGEGFTVPADWLDLTRQGHFGIAGMHERVEALGGEMIIHSQPGLGTRITVTVPITPPRA